MVYGIDFVNPGFVDSCLISLICVAIVFAMLALLWGICSLFKLIPQKKEEAPAKAPVASAPAERKSISIDDIKDEDMMVAALVATIDYRNEKKEDVRVTSIKEL